MTRTHILIGQDTERVECWPLCFLGSSVNLTVKRNHCPWLWQFIAPGYGNFSCSLQDHTACVRILGQEVRLEKLSSGTHPGI